MQEGENIRLTVQEGENAQMTTEQLRIIEAVSPTVTAERNEEGILVTVHDLNGTRTVQVYDGEDGVGIRSIEKTGTDGLTDTYTITFTNEQTATFTVTNGADGDPGADGNSIVSIEKTGTSGLVDTYTITFTKSSPVTFTVTNGGKGDTGNGIASIEKTGTSGLVDTYTITFTNGQTATFTVTNGAKGDPGADAEIPGSRVTSLTQTPLASVSVIESVGIPVYVNNVSQYAAYGITETGWYTFARIAAKKGVVVTAQTTVTGADGSIVTAGADHVDVAVRFEVAAASKTVSVIWNGSEADTFVFKATDLAVRNLDYRSTFYVYDISDYVTWSYALTTDTTFAEGKQYYTESGGVYTPAEVTTGANIPANTYYNHSKLTFSGMIRNVTYRLNEIVDCPIEIVLPAVPDDGYGAWFEIQMQFSGSSSITLLPPDATVKIGTASTQGQTAGINVVDLTYSDVNGVKIWTLLNTHTNIPTS